MQHNIFISHAWKYSDDYNTVLKWLKETPNFDFKNYSVPEHDPVIANNKTKLKEALCNQIVPAGVVIVISGMYAAYSEWIDFEVNAAKEMGKYIIGLKPWGNERIPKIVTDNADNIVGWNRESLINAIKYR